MFRKTSSTIIGQTFEEKTISAVWNKASPILGYDSNALRKDKCGAWISKPMYGTTSDLGWEVDHIIPVSKGGSDSIENLQPLQWQNNRHKGDVYPSWQCRMVARQ